METTNKSCKCKHSDWLCDFCEFENFKSVASKMDRVTFYEFCTYYLKNTGHYIHLDSGRTLYDGQEAVLIEGIDIIAYHHSINKYPQIKVKINYESKSQVGVQSIREISKVINYPYSSGMIITSGEFADEAICESELNFETKFNNNKIELIDIKKLYNFWISGELWPKKRFRIL